MNMNTFNSQIFMVNKIERTILTIIAMGAVLFTTLNVVWLAGLFGIELTNSLTQQILDALANGATLTGAFAMILGVTLPAWAVAAAGALGLTAA